MNFNVSSQIVRINALSKDNFTYVGLGKTISKSKSVLSPKDKQRLQGLCDLEATTGDVFTQIVHGLGFNQIKSVNYDIDNDDEDGLILAQHVQALPFEGNYCVGQAVINPVTKVQQMQMICWMKMGTTKHIEGMLIQIIGSLKNGHQKWKQKKNRTIVTMLTCLEINIKT